MPEEDSSRAIRADLDHVVHPFSALRERTPANLLMVDRAEGLRFVDTDGNEYLDAKSGLINVNVGWGRSELGQVAGEVTERLGYASLFFDQGHVPGALLAEKLAQLAPGAIDRFLFTVGGSDANETALKFARMYHAARGLTEKTKVIAREKSYHGMSLGATSVTGASVYWEGVGPLVPGVRHIPQPDPRDPRAAEVLERAIEEEGPQRVAAFIAEPISNPAGVNVPGADYWPAVREICTRHDVLLIVDEVITGFGRTGRMFACEHWGLEPDLLVMSKGLTSGYQPLGATGFTPSIIETIGDPGTPLFHGFTAGGHPAACAVALANIDIIERERLVDNAEWTGTHLRGRLEALSRDHGLGAVRGLGLLVALDIVAQAGTDRPFSADGGVGERIESRLREGRMLIRRVGDTVILAPSLVATLGDIDEIVDRLADAVAAELHAPTPVPARAD